MAKQRAPRIAFQQRGGTKHHNTMRRFILATLKDLCSTRLANTLDITVRVRQAIPNADKKTRGTCSLPKTIIPKRKRITIHVLRDELLDVQLSVLAHELVHVVQVAQGRLRSDKQGRYWRPVGHKGSAIRYAYDHPYRDQPWEIEAREYQHNRTTLARICKARRLSWRWDG